MPIQDKIKNFKKVNTEQIAGASEQNKILPSEQKEMNDDIISVVESIVTDLGEKTQIDAAQNEKDGQHEAIFQSLQQQISFNNDMFLQANDERGSRIEELELAKLANDSTDAAQNEKDGQLTQKDLVHDQKIAALESKTLVLSLSGQTLSIQGGNSVTLPQPLQNLSLSGQTLSIQGGNSVTLPQAFSSEYESGDFWVGGIRVLNANNAFNKTFDLESKFDSTGVSGNIADSTRFTFSGVVANGEYSVILKLTSLPSDLNFLSCQNLDKSTLVPTVTSANDLAYYFKFKFLGGVMRLISKAVRRSGGTGNYSEQYSLSYD
jgi:hypothetical protein